MHEGKAAFFGERQTFRNERLRGFTSHVLSFDSVLITWYNLLKLSNIVFEQELIFQIFKVA